MIDTPGIRSFGLAHIEPDDVLLAFSDLADAIKDCPRGCGHMGPPADPECALDALTGPAARRVAAARRLLAVLREQCLACAERARLYADTPCRGVHLRTLAVGNSAVGWKT